MLDRHHSEIDIEQSISTEIRRSTAVKRTTARPTDDRRSSDVLRWTFAAAVAITTVIATASFVLSFATLWDLATRAGLPSNLSWLWPVIVDGTILQATISVIALAPIREERSARRFFWGVLAVAAVVSISSNALHAFITPSGSLPPALAAAIATVAPVSLLAATHGIAVLSRARSTRDGSTAGAAAPQRTFVTADVRRADRADPVDERDAHVDDFATELVLEPGEWPNWYDVALTMRDRGLTNRPREEIVEILRGKYEHDLSNRQIAKSIDVHHSTVGRVVAAANAVLRTD